MFRSLLKAHPIVHFPKRLGVSEWASKQMSASEHASKASRVEQADELILQANKQMSQWMSEWPRTYVRIHGSSELICCFRCLDHESSEEKGGKGLNEFCLNLYVAWLIFFFFHLILSWHNGTKPGCFETSNHTLFHELGCERESKQMSAWAKRAVKSKRMCEWCQKKRANRRESRYIRL